MLDDLIHRKNELDARATVLEPAELIELIGIGQILNDFGLGVEV